jgi:hypothetical protein
MKKTKHSHKVVVLNVASKTAAAVIDEIVSLLDSGYDIISEQVLEGTVVYVLRKYNE